MDFCMAALSSLFAQKWFRLNTIGIHWKTAGKLQTNKIQLPNVNCMKTSFQPFLIRNKHSFGDTPLHMYAQMYGCTHTPLIFLLTVITPLGGLVGTRVLRGLRVFVSLRGSSCPLLYLSLLYAAQKFSMNIFIFVYKYMHV